MGIKPDNLLINYPGKYGISFLKHIFTVKTVRQLMVARDVGELVGVVVVTDLGLSKERSSRNVCPFWRIFRPQLHSWRSKLDVEFEAIGLDAADVICNNNSGEY